MLRIVLYRSEKNIEEFLKEKFEHNNGLGSVHFISPNPGTSDYYRGFFQKNDLSIDPLTISQFLKVHLRKDNEELELQGKRELFQLLATIWKDTVGAQDFVAFLESYNLFTDLRSYGPTNEVFQEILQQLEPTQAKLILKYHSIFEHLEVLDEFKSYDLVPSLLNGEGNQFYFVGFSHLSAKQIDFLKNISNDHEVYLFYSHYLYQKRQSFDWISWVNDVAEVYQAPELEFDSPSVYRFQAQSLSHCYHRWTNSDKVSGQIICGVNGIEIDQYFPLPIDNINYKHDLNTFSDEISEIFADLKFGLGLGKKSSTAITVNQLKNFLKNEIDLIFTKGKQERSFIRLKSLLLFLEETISWEQLSDQNNQITDFDLRVLRKTAELAAPRISASQIIKTKDFFSLTPLLAPSDLDPAQKVVILIKSGGGFNIMKRGKYNPMVNSILATIGPMQRFDLDIDLVSSRLEELLHIPHAEWWIEEGVEQSDPFWKKSLSPLLPFLNEANDSELIKEKKARVFLIKNKTWEQKNYSPGKLQSFLDCPQKFYFSYIEPYNFPTKGHAMINNAALGELAHELIGQVDYAHFEESLLQTKLNELLENYFQRNQLNPTKFEVKKAAHTVYNLAFPSVSQLADLVKMAPDTDLLFEKEIQSEDGQGRADLLGLGSHANFVLDFKKSSYAIPSKKELSLFENIQIYFYISRLLPQVGKLDFFGFQNLEEPEKSLFFKASDSTLINCFSLKKSGIVSIDLDAEIEKYREFENELIKKIQSEKTFMASPRKKEICEFCHLKFVCPERRDS